MKLKEKLSARTFNCATELKISGDRKVCDGIYIDDNIGVITYDDALTIIQQAVNDACNRQREICAKVYLTEIGYETSHSIIADQIKNAPNPKVI